MATLSKDIAAVRRFSRFYTQRIGFLSDGFLDSPWSLTETRVLYEIAHSDGVTPSRVASELRLDTGYVSRVVKRFQKAGFIRREKSVTDRRQVLLTLTDSGAQAFEEINSSSRAQIGALLTATDRKGRQRLVDAMEVVEQVLDADSPAVPRVTYRPHREGDLGWVVQRHAELYHVSHGWDVTFEAMVAEIAAEFIRSYDPVWERSWIAEVDGRRAGSIALVCKSKTVGQLRLLIVEPFARGLGVGTRLVSECVGQARHVGYRKVVLHTVRGLDSARRIYENEGFELAAERPTHEWGKDQMEQTWELAL
jgi:DNA-binding MarR family transcriptional regulator/N-acetylglutamate synthase-like GNAT family acetyltransferase